MNSDKNLDRATQICVAFAANNHVESNRLPDIIKSVYLTLQSIGPHESLDSGGQNLEVAVTPAVPIENSITEDHIICLEDGKKLKMLKRYLRTNYGLSPDDYRRRWGLDADYPLVAPSYSKVRSNFAKEKGLGRKASD